MTSDQLQLLAELEYRHGVVVGHPDGAGYELRAFDGGEPTEKLREWAVPRERALVEAAFRRDLELSRVSPAEAMERDALLERAVNEAMFTAWRGFGGDTE